MNSRTRWIRTARPSQVTPDGDWLTWLILAGRGWGKTRTGAEDVAWYGLSHPGSRLAVIAPTYSDARDTCIEGDSGLVNVLPKGCIETWNRSLGELILYNGSRYKLFSADEPERLRGPQHHRAWADELGAWRYAEAWDQLQFGLRLGDRPQVVVTTTPKPTPLVRMLAKNDRTRITRGSTFDNAANLAEAALTQLRQRYQGTRLGRQELEAEILDDVPGALWTRRMVDRRDDGNPLGAAMAQDATLPEMQRVVVAIDPSGGGDEIGIVVAGKGYDGLAYVIADRTCSLSPAGWGREAVRAYHEFRADRIIAERNFGGDMVEATIRSVDASVSYSDVVASRGKAVRAEPVAALYEQGRVRHAHELERLEDQMCAMAQGGYLGEGSPDRLDAMVWAVTDLMLGEPELNWASLLD